MVEFILNNGILLILGVCSDIILLFFYIVIVGKLWINVCNWILKRIIELGKKKLKINIELVIKRSIKGM